MYKKLIRPFLFLLNPEKAHIFTIFSLKVLRYIPFGKQIAEKIFAYKSPKLERNILNLKFKNPVGIAAGLDKNAECFDTLSHMGVGFIEVGTVTPVGQSGNPKPRLFRLIKDKAIINRMGFNNKGASQVVKNIKRFRKNCAEGTIIGGNVGKNTITNNENAAEDYLKSFSALYDYVDYFTVNVSCPNVTNLRELQNKDSVYSILEKLTSFRANQKIRKPIFLKISSDLTMDQVETMVDVAKESGIDGIVAVNTTTSREGLQTNKKTIENIGKGGLSGAPLTERSVAIVKHIVEYSGNTVPVIGVGGIMKAKDAINMLEAGASLVQIYSGYIYNGPAFPKEICKAIISKC